MSEKHTEADVIWRRDDARVKIGGLYKVGDNPYEAIATANSPDCVAGELLTVSDRFYKPFRLLFRDGKHEPKTLNFACLIAVRKESCKKKIVPFDLSKEEDRKAVRGKYIKFKGDNPDNKEMLVTVINDNGAGDLVEIIGSSILADKYVFADTGKPVGMEVEE